jgi:deoxyribonuclease-2
MRNLLLSVFAFSISAAALQCKSDSGAAVDTWVAFKGPKGTDYDYWDTETALGASKHSMNDTTVGALGATLSQLWLTSTEYLLWNDSPPGAAGYNYTVGHSKGVWAWNLATGDAIIVQHSVPQFPQGPSAVEKYVGLGSNAWMYGQHAACFHTTVSELARLAPLAELAVPGIYDSRVSGGTPAPLAALADGAFSTDAQCESISFETVGGVNITYFAKSTQWNNELYSECLAPTLQTSLLVESWIRGSAEGPACGGALHVNDVQSLAYPGGMSFTEYDDHSKWAISAGAGAGPDIFCASDINRMTTQFARGGGAYCWEDASLVGALAGSISGADSC